MASLQPEFQGTLEDAIDIGDVSFETTDKKSKNASNILDFQGDCNEGLEVEWNDGDHAGDEMEKEGNSAPISDFSADTSGLEVSDSDEALQIVGPEVPAYEGDALDGEKENLDGIDSGFERMGVDYMGEEVAPSEREIIDPQNAYSLFVSKCSKGTVPFVEEEVSTALEEGKIGKNDQRFLVKLINQQKADEQSGAEVKAAQYTYAYFNHLKEGRFLGGRGGAFVFNYMCKVLALKNHPFGLRMNNCALNDIKLNNAVLSDLVLIRVNVWKGGIDLRRASITGGYYMAEVMVKNGDIDENGVNIGTGQFQHHINISNGSLKQKRALIGLKSSNRTDPNWGIIDQYDIKVGGFLLQDDIVCAEQRQRNIHVGADFLHSNVDTKRLVQRNVTVAGLYRPMPTVIPSQCIRRINVHCSDFDWSTEDNIPG